VRLFGGVRILDRPCLPNVRKIDQMCFPMLNQMHTNGILVDRAHMTDLEHKLSARLGEIESDIDCVIGTEWATFQRARHAHSAFSPTSPDQVAELLFDALQLKPPGKPRAVKGGDRFSTEDEVLSSMVGLHPAPGLILDHREISKLLTTYVLPIPGMVSLEDGRLRTVFKPNRARTGRLACGDRSQGKPNLQNIPVRGDWGKHVRNGFIAGINPRTGKRNVLASMDLSQIEMRLAAYLSGDTNMAQIFIEGLDIHNRTACALFQLAIDHINYLAEIAAREEATKSKLFTEAEGREWKQFKHKYRLPAKTLGFGVLYGVTARGLQMQILAAGGPLLTEEECQQYIDAWFRAYPGIARWMQLQYQRARQYGMVWNMFGRIRPIPEVHCHSEHKRGEGDRESGNTPVQGSAGDILKLIMGEMTPIVEAFQSYRDEVCLPLLQIHDELVFELSVGIAEEFLEMGKAVARNSVPLLIDATGEYIPVESSADMAERWGSIK
jgi:DNA polymerase-1